MTRNAGTLDTGTAAIQIQIKPNSTDYFDDCYPVVFRLSFNTQFKVSQNTTFMAYRIFKHLHVSILFVKNNKQKVKKCIICNTLYYETL